MISFRFHVVSITAIFLAIAIGVVVGSTYIEGSVVEGLENRIDTVEERATAAREENDRLEAERSIARDYIDLSSEYAVSDRLVDVPVFVVAARGVDESAVERTVVLARRAGGRVPGVVWLEPRWAAEGDEDLAALAAAVDGSASADPAELWAAAWVGISEELVAEEAAEQDGDTPSQGGPGAVDVLAELEAAGFLTVDSLDDDTVSVADLAGAAPRMLFISGSRAEAEVAPVVPVAVRASAEGGLITLVADVHVSAPEAPGRGARLLDTFDEALREVIVLVDDADIEEGRVAVVLGLAAAADGELGRHYGYGEGADAVLPGWTAP